MGLRVSTFRIFCKDQERRIVDLLARLGSHVQPCDKPGPEPDTDWATSVYRRHTRRDTIRGKGGT